MLGTAPQAKPPDTKPIVEILRSGNHFAAVLMQVE